MQLSALPSGLPEPDAETLAHSRRVAAFIAERIAAGGGAITFGDFMHHALYAPGLGYYAAGAQKFGRAGDFVTAPDVSPLFARAVAAEIAPLLGGLSGSSVLELGAGSGSLACALLGRLAELEALPRDYLILEASAELVARQQERIASAAPEVASRVRWTDRLPEGFSGVVIANEVADALPVERFRIRKGALEQAWVRQEDGRFRWSWRAAGERLAMLVDGLGIDFPEGYESDLCPPLKPWISDLVTSLETGIVILFDYGISRRDYYAPDRRGWLRCHFRHRVHDDPLILPGAQDLSCWVDFTAVAEAAADSGASVAGYATQAMFLVHAGIASDLTAQRPAREQAELAQQIKWLTLPGEMGEYFKCIVLARGEVPVPPAIVAADRSHLL